MNATSIQQEILLISDTSFCKDQLCPKDTSDEQRAYTVIEQLEDACWSGLLYDMFPGIIEKSAKGKKLFLWQVLQNNGCLEMELGEYPKEIEDPYSINPYKFLLAIRSN